MGKIRDLLGQRFGRLIVIKFNGLNERRKAYWLCKCDCGNEVSVRTDGLTSGHTQSCGCYNREMSTLKNSKPNARKNLKLYGVWKEMRQRCNNSNHKRFKDYGGRGISVCSEWQNDFELFYSWAITNGYEEGLTIDRINNDGNYCPDNCCWATYKEQCNHTRRNHYITINNETKTLNEWANISNLSYKVISDRIKRGWPETDLLIPLLSKNSKRKRRK